MRREIRQKYFLRCQVVVEHGFNLFPENLSVFDQETGGGIISTSDQGTSFSFFTDANGLDANTIQQIDVDSV